MANNSIARGFRFYPTEEELVGFYLRNKLENKRKDMERVIPVVDVYSFEPSQLPQMSGEPCIWDSEQWFFFCPRQMREAQGGRPTRTTASGYWKATGSPAPVYSSSSSSSSSSSAIAIGVKKTMVFYEGRAPHGFKTKWKMNEYKALRIEQGDTATTAAATQPTLCNDFSLCRVYIKSGCRRAFDRRPPPLTSSSGADGVTRSHAAVATVGESSSERPVDGSHDSSSSGDHGRDGDDDDDWRLIEGMDWDFFDSI